jgi:hypothetical protein
LCAEHAAECRACGDGAHDGACPVCGEFGEECEGRPVTGAEIVLVDSDRYRAACEVVPPSG